VSEIISGDLKLEESDLGGIYSTSQMQSEFSKMKKSLKEALKDKNADGIQSDDSLIWFIDWTDPISSVSVRKALYYDKLTGIARYYEAIYQFPPQLRLAYDSTEIKADLNFTLEDFLDDKFLELYKLTNFKDGFYVEKIEANAEAIDWDANNQVIGAALNNRVWYGEHTRLEELVQELQIHPDETGRIFEQLNYRDGTFLQKTVNFYADYTGDYSEVWRNGTQVSGTFDRLEDDNHASLTRVVDFPAGFFLNKIEQSADYTLNPEDSSSHAILNEKIFFANGLLDTSQLVIDEFFENDLKKTHLVGSRSDGSHADLLVTHFSDFQEIEGNYTGPDGYFSLIEATLYSDGSGELWLKVYESEEAYLNGEPPVATIYIHFNPDGSGGGEVSEGNVKYSVQVDQNGEMVVTDDAGKRQIINGF
jgi:hypothetical protein